MSRYEEIRANLKTGDIILFSGKGAISHGIKLMTNSKWSHVGMVLKLPESKAVFVWESTTINTLRDAVDGKAKSGVQLVLLSDRLRTYPGDVTIRHLQNYIVDNTQYMNLMKFREEVKNRPYEKSKLELIKAAYDGPFGHNEEDLSSLFCSELVAEAYQRIGLLDEPPSGKSSNEYTPKDFTESASLRLRHDAVLSHEYSLVDK